MNKKRLEGILKKVSNYWKTNKRSLVLPLLGGGGVLLVIYLIYTFFSVDDGPSYIKESSTKLISKRIQQTKKLEVARSSEIPEVGTEMFQEIKVLPSKAEKIQEVKIKHQKKINYRAKQVLSRGQGNYGVAGVAAGTNLIGKLLTSVDTRDPDAVIRVLLPYGSNAKNDVMIPPNSLLVGRYRYHGSSERVMTHFNKCIFPDGQEFQIEAQALDSSDYKSGIKGEHHSNAAPRIVTTLGLSMVAGMAEVFTEKVALGDGYAVAPKPSMENAFSQGAAKAANGELERQLRGTSSNDRDYLTIDSGKELIISLTNAFRGMPIVQN